MTSVMGLVLPRARRPRYFVLDEIAALAVAIEAFLPQRVDGEHDLAPIAAAHRGHQLLEEFGAVGKRRRDRCEPLAGKARRLRHAGLEPGAAAERPGQVEAGFGAGPLTPCERRVERQGAHALHHHEVAVGLEAGAERPVHLLVGENVDVGIDYEHVLDVDQRPEAGGDRVARLARDALAQRHPEVEHAAARRRGVNGNGLAHRGLERAPDHDLGAQRVEQRGIGAARANSRRWSRSGTARRGGA